MKKIYNYNHIIWDWNGTIMDDSWLSASVISSMLAKRNIPTLSHSQYKEKFSFPIQNFYESLGFDFKKEHFHTVALEFIDLYNSRRKECKLHNGILDILQIISQHNCSQSIISAYQKNFLNEIVDFYHIKNYFSNILGLDDIFAKTKLELTKNYFKTLNIPKEKILFIGDTDHDLHASQSINCDCILISHGHYNYNRLSNIHHAVVRNVSELKEKLFS